jgi:adenine/guanine phosphoribosyltransferase-like PRPP-binding protein
LLKILKARLSVTSLPFVYISKYFPNQIPVPQKSLKTREQRIRNATETIIVDDSKAKNYRRVLLIDDFVGSGATLNITAKKLKDVGVQEVIGCAFVGNADLKYDVINEV